MLTLRALLLCALLAPLALLAQDDAKTSYDNTYKTLDAKAAPPSEAQNLVIIKSAFATLEANPAHNRARELVRKLQDYPDGIDKKQPGIVSDWFLQTRLALLDQLYKEGLTPPQVAAFAALDAAFATSKAKHVRSKENVIAARDKIDALANKPESNRFLPDREIAYYEILRTYSADAAAKFIAALAESPNKELATRAADEMRLAEVKKAPFDLTFSDHAGKAFDASKIRGKKLLFLHFWSVKKDASLKAMEGLNAMLDEFPSLVIVGINLDDEADRPAVLAAIKKNRANWPHLIEGKGLENSVAQRLNIREASAGGILFNEKGFYSKLLPRPDSIRQTLKPGAKPKK